MRFSENTVFEHIEFESEEHERAGQEYWSAVMFEQTVVGLERTPARIKMRWVCDHCDQTHEIDERVTCVTDLVRRACKKGVFCQGKFRCFDCAEKNPQVHRQAVRMLRALVETMKNCPKSVESAVGYRVISIDAHDSLVRDAGEYHRLQAGADMLTTGQSAMPLDEDFLECVEHDMDLLDDETQAEEDERVFQEITKKYQRPS